MYPVSLPGPGSRGGNTQTVEDKSAAFWARFMSPYADIFRCTSESFERWIAEVSNQILYQIRAGGKFTSSQGLKFPASDNFPAFVRDRTRLRVHHGSGRLDPYALVINLSQVPSQLSLCGTNFCCDFFFFQGMISSTQSVSSIVFTDLGNFKIHLISRMKLLNVLYSICSKQFIPNLYLLFCYFGCGLRTHW